jgi:hypothetical protein
VGQRAQRASRGKVLGKVGHRTSSLPVSDEPLTGHDAVVQEFVDALRLVPAGVWTLLVAALGFLVAWGKDRQAKQERDQERQERHELRAADEQKERDRQALEDARYWRDRHLVVLADYLCHAQELVNQCVLRGGRVLTAEAMATMKQPLDGMTRQEPQVRLLCTKPVRDEVTKCSLFAWQCFGDVDAAYLAGRPLPDWSAWPALQVFAESLDHVLVLSTTEIRSPASAGPPAD